MHKNYIYILLVRNVYVLHVYIVSMYYVTYMYIVRHVRVQCTWHICTVYVTNMYSVRDINVLCTCFVCTDVRDVYVLCTWRVFSVYSVWVYKRINFAALYCRHHYTTIPSKPYLSIQQKSAVSLSRTLYSVDSPVHTVQLYRRPEVVETGSRNHGFRRTQH